MSRPARDPARRLRATVERLPNRTKEAMLRGIATNRIVVGAYTDPRSGGICPMLAAHRNGGRTDLAAFARAWDEYTGAKRPRRATRREVRTLRTLLEESLQLDGELERTPIAELAAQIRAEREQLYGCGRGPGREPLVEIPEPEDSSIRVRREDTIRVRRRRRTDLLAATERELTEAERAGAEAPPV